MHLHSLITAFMIASTMTEYVDSNRIYCRPLPFSVLWLYCSCGAVQCLFKCKGLCSRVPGGESWCIHICLVTSLYCRRYRWAQTQGRATSNHFGLCMSVIIEWRAKILKWERLSPPHSGLLTPYSPIRLSSKLSVEFLLVVLAPHSLMLTSVRQVHWSFRFHLNFFFNVTQTWIHWDCAIIILCRF